MTDSIFLGHYLFHLIRTFFSLPLSSFFRSYFQFCFSFLHHYKILSFLTSSYSFLLSFLNLLLFQLYHSVFNCFLISSYFLSFLTFFPLWNRDPYRKQTSKLNDAGKCHWVTGCRTKNGHEMWLFQGMFIKTKFFWKLTLCRLVNRYRSFHEKQCVHHHSKLIFISPQGTAFLMVRSLKQEGIQLTNLFPWKELPFKKNLFFFLIR